jgi:hypothetical protein
MGRRDEAPATRSANASASEFARRSGWTKTCGGLRQTRHRGTARVGWTFTLTAAACNLIRLPKLLAMA